MTSRSCKPSSKLVLVVTTTISSTRDEIISSGSSMNFMFVVDRNRTHSANRVDFESVQRTKNTVTAKIED